MKPVIAILLICFLISCEITDKEKVFASPTMAGISYENMLSYQLDISIEPSEVGCLRYKTTDSVDVDLDHGNDFFIHINYVKPDLENVCCNCPPDDPVCECFYQAGTRLRYMTCLSSFFQVLIDEQQSTNHHDLVSLLDYGDTINSNATWINGENLVFYYTTFSDGSEYGNWSDVSDGYIGIRNISEQDTSYGWINLEMHDTCIIKSMSIQYY